jgi:hypothetical protein
MGNIIGTREGQGADYQMQEHAGREIAGQRDAACSVGWKTALHQIADRGQLLD